MQTTPLFFSIIVPAHNEGAYIDETLTHLRDMEYPTDRFEVLVIENGSTDDTLARAKKFEAPNITVVASHTKGVSRAKNAGIDRLNSVSDWTIFLDADTLLKKEFLKELNDFLVKNHSKNFTVGTTAIRPLSQKQKAHFWFAFYDIMHRLNGTSYSIQIFKSTLLKHIRFDEGLTMGEDLQLIRDAQKHGRFFFFSTKQVFTSVRRFEKEGWWYIFFSWTFVAILPKPLQKKFGYKVVR